MPRHHILIADDDRLLCELVASAFRAEGHEAAMAFDGETALAALRRRPVDLLILDANMPGMDGFAVLDVLRRDATLASMPVLMLTGRRDETAVINARELGAGAYVAKPFKTMTLLTRCYALIGAGRRTPLPAAPARTPPPALATEVYARVDDTEWID